MSSFPGTTYGNYLLKGRVANKKPSDVPFCQHISMTRKMRKSDNIAIVRKMCVTRWWWWFEGGRTDFRTLLSKKGHHHYLSFSSPGLQKNVAICASFICINTWDLMTPIFAARVQTYNKFCCDVLYNDKVRCVDTIPFFSNLHTHVLSFFLLCSIFKTATN